MPIGIHLFYEHVCVTDYVDVFYMLRSPNRAQEHLETYSHRREYAYCHPCVCVIGSPYM